MPIRSTVNWGNKKCQNFISKILKKFADHPPNISYNLWHEVAKKINFSTFRLDSMHFGVEKGGEMVSMTSMTSEDSLPAFG